MNEHFTRAPHRSSTSQPGAGPHAALMIDFDNVTMGIRSNLGQELRTLLDSDIIRGKVSVQRAYADWRRYPQYIVPLSEASIDLIFAPAYGSTKKNATDIRLAIDALELVFTRPEIGTFILLSGDSDFSSLVLKLKEYGKYIIGVGLQESSSDLLVQNCDEYYSYNSLSGLTSAEDMDTERHDPWELAEKAVRRMKERNDVMRSDRLKQVMLELDQSFDEKEHGFSKFNRFLAEASSRGLIRLHRIENGQYEVDLGKAARSARGDGAAAEAPAPEPTSGQPPKQRSRRGGKPSGGGRPEAATSVPTEAASLRKAYDLLRDVVDALSENGEPVRDSEIKREMLRRDAGFDEAEYGFRKFSRFLRQAHDEEVVDLITDENGNYHLTPAGSGAASGVTTVDGRPGTGQKPRKEEHRGRRRDRTPPADEPETSGPEERKGTPTADETATEPPAEPGATADAEETPAGPETGEPSRAKRRTRRGVGRFGRRSRSAGGDDGGQGLPGPVGSVGPVDEGSGGPSEEVEPGDGATEKDARARPGATAETSGGRRGLGRYRTGSRSGGPGAKAPSLPEVGPVREVDAGDEDAGDDTGEGERPDHEPAGAGTASAPGGDVTAGADGGRRDPDVGTTSAPGGPAGEAVEHMIRNYPGVGRKTAEKLVDEFGQDVFRIIDDRPERLSGVLPQHRAQAVVEAREAEREKSAT